MARKIAVTLAAIAAVLYLYFYVAYQPLPFPGRYVLDAQGKTKLDTWTGDSWSRYGWDHEYYWIPFK